MQVKLSQRSIFLLWQHHCEGKQRMMCPLPPPPPSNLVPLPLLQSGHYHVQPFTNNPDIVASPSQLLDKSVATIEATEATASVKVSAL